MKMMCLYCTIQSAHPLFNDYNNGLEAKLWNYYFNNSQQGFEKTNLLKANKKN